MNEIIIFIGMWIGIALIQYLIYKMDKTNNNKNVNL
jgi:hypothetical protein